MIAAAERIFEFLEEDEETKDAQNPVSTQNIKGNIKFDHVHFSYDPEKTIINDFNSSVKDGQKIAIVGPTGAGKTTMVKLLMRFYDVNSGSISIDGHNIKDFKRGELRKLFGMVLQDTWAFGGTIKNADLILVMNEGDIVEQGTHDELLEKDGFYAKLYNSQFEEL